MARIAGVPPAEAGPFTRLVYRVSARMYGGEVPEPVIAQACHPLLMNGYGAFELAFQRSRKAPEKLKALAEMKAAAMAGCEWCLDFGSWLSRASGVTERQLRELPDFRDSDAFTADEKLVLEYAEGISSTPVDVSDELFERIRDRFTEPQIVELTYAAAIENLRGRFNWALGIGSQGFCKDGACAVPQAQSAPAG